MRNSIGNRWAALGAVLGIGLAGCGASRAEPRSAAAEGDVSPAAPASSAAVVTGKVKGSPLTDDAEVAFRADFSKPEVLLPWNLFGVSAGKRELSGGDRGLFVRILSGEKAWDAVGARTARVTVDGDFDLRARFREFSATGNGSAKLIVVGVSSRQDAAFVERVQIDGKNLFKFGGDIGGSLENWGFAPTDAAAGDLRLVRKAGVLHAFSRVSESGPWTEFARPMPAPSSMPRALKFGVKLSADAHRSAQVHFAELTMDGEITRGE
jgi:hypothetical protein